jgi:bacterioferritin (cytochrome b1)
MKQSLNFLLQTLRDIDLRAKRETMEHYRAMILYVERAVEFVTSATLVDFVIQDRRHEADLKNALGPRD